MVKGTNPEGGWRSKTDAERVKRTLNGDNVAFSELVTHYYQLFYALAMSYLHDTDKAEDIVQNGVLEIYRRLGTLHDQERFGSWGYTIIRRGCIHEIRHQKRETAGMSKYSEIQKMKNIQEDHNPNINASIEENDQKMIVRDAVNKLPEIYREISVLYFFNELDYSEISKLLQISMRAVVMRLYRAKKILQNELGGQL